MTDFEIKLKHINGHMPFCKVPKKCTCGANDRNERITKLVADTVLKAIGEDDKGDYDITTNLGLIRSNAKVQRNQLRSEIKAKVFEMLGIKEK